MAGLALSGCGHESVTIPNTAPHTTIFIQGPVDTVNHVVHLFWFGTDAHGYIVGYEVRLLNPVAPADTNWRLTTRTDSVVTVLTPTGFTAAVFEARAINDRGVRDPNPARELFKFRNHPPKVTFRINDPNTLQSTDVTFPTATIEWDVQDADGDPTKVVTRVWLDGNESTPIPVSGTSFTMPSTQFLQGGVYKSGPRTISIQGIDDGGMAGPIASVTWSVRQPVTGTRSRLLLIDDVPTTDASKTRSDTLYLHAIGNAGVPGNQWSVLHLQNNHPFRSAKDMEQTLRLFETVVWYRGEQALFSSVLANFGTGIGPYLDSGGRMFVESLNLTAAMSTNGALTPDFVSQYLNSDGVFLFPLPPDSSAAWGLAGSGVLRCPLIADSLHNSRIISGLRGFRTRATSQVLMYAPAHTFSQDNPIDMAIALAVPQANSGKFIVSTYPLVSGTVSTSGFPQRSSIVLLKILGLLGLTGP
jgi:hypothetical protein